MGKVVQVEQGLLKWNFSESLNNVLCIIGDVLCIAFHFPLSTFHFLLTSWQIWRFAHRIQVILNSKKPKIGFLSLNNHAIGQNLINFPLTRLVDCKAQ